MNSDLREYLVHKLKQEQDIYLSDLGDGKAKDFDEYKHSCGIIRGLLIASNIITETLDRMESEDE
jgi:hypothetical protein